MLQLVRGFVAAWSALVFWILNLPALLRLAWFPLALLSLAGYGWHYWRTAADLVLIAARDRPQQAAGLIAPPAMETTGGIFLWALLQLVALSSAAVAVHRFVVAGERPAGAYVTLAFGRAERAYFAMGVAAYLLMVALVAGQFLAQLEIPPIGIDLAASVIKPYAELGPWVLSLFVFPGELAIFDMPPLNYALWSALVIATGAVLIRLAPWPAAVAAERDLAFARTLSLTRGRTGIVLAYFAGVALAAVLVLALLSLAGLSSLAAAGPDALAGLLRAIAADGTAAPAAQDSEVASLLADRRIALYQEIARFVSGLFGVTLGATLVGRLYLALRNENA